MQMRPKLYVFKGQYITHHWHIQLCKWCRRNSRQQWSPVLVGKIIFATQGKYWPGCQLQAFKSYWATLFHLPTSTSSIGGASAFLSPSSKQCISNWEGPKNIHEKERWKCSAGMTNSHWPLPEYFFYSTGSCEGNTNHPFDPNTKPCCKLWVRFCIIEVLLLFLLGWPQFDH